MIDLNNLIARQEMRCEQLIIHVRQNSDAAEAEVERMYLLALLEDLANLKASVSGAKTRWSWNWPPRRLLWIKSIVRYISCGEQSRC